MIAARMGGSLRFADYELDLAAYSLRQAGHAVKLEKIPMELLILLVQRAGALVARSDIQAALWGGEVFVDHGAAINTAIRKIRQALGDDAETPRFVETVVGKGYRFVASVQRVPSSPRQSDTSRGSFPRYSIARGKQEFILKAAETVLGRDPEAGICIDHPSVSRRHASVSIGAGGAVLEDLSSRNGTFVNGRRIDGPVQIDHGAVIGLGALTLTFAVLRAPASTQSISADHIVD